MLKIPFNLTFFLTLSFVLSACGTSPSPPPESDPDWCYTMDFTSGDYGISIVSGQYVAGVGFQSVGGDLNLLYNHGYSIQIDKAIAHININYAGDVNFSATYNIFGIIASYADIVPDFITDYDLPIYKTEAGQAGSTAQITFSSPAIVTISSLYIQGQYPNPFPTNSCPNETQTPTPQSIPTEFYPTLTATNTALPTVTNTPTVTPTVAVTNYDWCKVYDFEIATHGAYGDFDFVNGVGLQDIYIAENTASIFTLNIDTPFINVYSLRYEYLTSGGIFGNIHQARLRLSETNVWFVTAVPQSSTNVYEPVINVSGDEIHFALHDTSASPSVTFKRLTIFGLGSNPFGVDDCNISHTSTPAPTETITQTTTPFPTSTITATATEPFNDGSPTPNNDYPDRCNFINYSFNEGSDNWITTGTGANGSLIVQSYDTFQQTVNLTETNYFLTVVAAIDDYGVSDSDGSLTLDYTITYPDTSSSSGTFPTLSETYIYQQGNEVVFTLPITTVPGNHSFDFTAQLTNMTSAKILQVCVSDVIEDENDNSSDDPTGKYGWQTCSDKIDSPSSVIEVGGWIQFLWNSQSQLIECVLMPPIRGIVANIVAFFGWTYHTAMGFFDWTFGAVFPYLSAHMANLFSIIQYLAERGFDFVSGAFVFFDVVGGAASTAENYTGTGIAYLGVIDSQIGQVINGYIDAPPTAIQGLPDCIDAPLDSDICAVYYVAEYTIFAGPVGSLIIPVVVIIIDLVALYAVAEFVKQLIYFIWKALE